MYTPLAEQPRIVLVGIRNAGKSSLMNAIFEKQVSIVSQNPGTTTDPVTRSFEVPGIGPAGFVDTAGIDDEGTLGLQRVKSTLERYKSADMILFITSAAIPPNKTEIALYSSLFGKNRMTLRPALLVLTHTEGEIDPVKISWEAESESFRVESPSRRGIGELIAGIACHKPEPEATPLDGLVTAGDTILLVVPIDSAAPKGRIILPQVEVIRDALDKDCAALVAKEHELETFYWSLKVRPRLVITDSQAFKKVAKALPADQPLTSFSILFARKKGDLSQFISGLDKLTHLPEKAKILILESCSHKRTQHDDIGTVQIPEIVQKNFCPDAEFTHARQLPTHDQLKSFDLIIQCASCMLTRGKVISRLEILKRLEVPVTNYGLFLAMANGLFPRALEPIPIIQR